MTSPHLFTVGGNLATLYNRSKALYMLYDPCNPLRLPANTIRVRTSDGNAPSRMLDTTYETATLVHGTNDVYDVYKSGASFFSLLRGSTNVTEVLGANTSNVTDMTMMFLSCVSLTSLPLFDTSNVTTMQAMLEGCYSLITVPLFDTSKVTNMYRMFQASSSLITVPLFNTIKVTTMYSMFSGCSSLKSVPLFDTSNVTDMSSMFSNCYLLITVPLFNTFKVTDIGYMFLNCANVNSGALALYQQASTQTKPPTYHDLTFRHCGENTYTGSIELAQIPMSWGGSLQE